MSLINCNECGKEISDNAKSCPNCGNPINKSRLWVTIKLTKFKWATIKLIIGIISIIFSLVIFVESRGHYSGSYGFLCALLMLYAAITSIASRKSDDKGGSIATIIHYWLVSVFSIIFYPNFSVDLFLFLTVGIVTFCFGLINLCSIFARSEIFQNKKKNNLLCLFADGILILACLTILTNIAIFIRDGF